MSIFEAAMVLCFGASWPVSIHKALRTRVVFLYAFNAVLVLVDLTLHLCFSRLERGTSAA